MRVVGIASCLAGAPVATLALLAAGRWAEFWPAMMGIVVITTAACAFAFVWARDLDLLTEAVRRVRIDEAAPVAEATEAVLMETLGREIERLARRLSTRSALQEKDRRADTLILERLPDPVIVVARDRTLRRTNAAARAAFGDDMAAVLRHPGLRAAIDRALGSSLPQTTEVGLRAPVPRDVYATVVPMDPPLADGGQALVVLSDRTRERVVERMRADFVANVSHELRTPLASLIGFIETLLGPAADDPPAQRRFLGIMAEQGARMNRLIDDLLSLSRIELTEHQTPSEPLDLALLISRMAAGFEPRLAQRKVRLVMTVQEALPNVAGDADQMAQVMQNLLDNAVKYGREGGVLRVDVGPRAAWRPLAEPARDRHRRCRPGGRHRQGASAEADRAVLPGGQGPVAHGWRHRSGAGDRQAHRQPPPGTVADRKRGRQGDDRQRVAAGTFRHRPDGGCELRQRLFPPLST